MEVISLTIETAPSRRILIVLTEIINRQPVTFTELVKILPVSRSGVWRALETLHEMNWVIKRNGDGAFRVTEEMSFVFRHIDALTPGIDTVSGIIRHFKNARFDADYGQFTSFGHFQLLESSRASAYDTRPSSMVTDDLCIAAQAQLSMAKLLLHLREFQRIAVPADQNAIRNGKHAKIIAKARSEQITWSQEYLAFSVGVSLVSGLSGAIRVHAGSNSIDSLEAIAQSVPQTSNLSSMHQWIETNL